MKNFQNFLTEKKGEQAHKEAIAMGLQYKGFGYWVDPNTGETKFKTENDRLVPVDPEVESDMYKDDKEGGGAPPERGPGGGMSYGQMMDVQNTMQPQINAGENVGDAPPPGAEKAPYEQGWTAGPDGDHCVDSDNPPGQIPQDSFVGRHNSLGWIAGPDGSYFPAKPNLHEAEDSSIKYNPDRNQHAKNVARRARVGSMPGIKDGAETKFDADLAQRQGTDWMHGYMRRLGASAKDDPKENLQQSVLLRLKNFLQAEKKKSAPPAEPSFEPRSQMDAKMKGDKSFNWDGNDNTLIGAVDAIDQAGPVGKKKAEMELSLAGKTELGGGPRTRAGIFRQQARRTPAVIKDAERGAEMTDMVREQGLFADPEYNLNRRGEYLGGGMFGQVFRGQDQFNGMDTIIKEGNIGPDELIALRAMQDNPAFPTLVNAQFTGPFNYDSALKNNPFGGNTRIGQGRYFDPQNYPSYEETGFQKRFPTAPGMIAMTQQGGTSLYDMMQNGELQDVDLSEVAKQIFAARMAMHKQGIAHQDMHMGNLFWDQDNNQAGVIDFGMAKQDWRHALAEALGGMTDDIDNMNNRGDYQLTEYAGKDRLPRYLRERLEDNIENINQALMDRWDGDAENDEEGMEEHNYKIADFLRGGLRMSDNQLTEWLDSVGVDEKFGKELIEMLYDRFDDPDDTIPTEPEATPEIPMAPKSGGGRGITSIANMLFGR